MDSITEIIFLPLPLLCIIGSINRFIWQKPSRSSADGWQTACWVILKDGHIQLLVSAKRFL